LVLWIGERVTLAQLGAFVAFSKGCKISHTYKYRKI
jgi:hypothetical protein